MNTRFISFFICLLFNINVNAYDFIRDGIFYNIISQEDATCEVASEYDYEYVESTYSGYVIIPETVYDNISKTEYTVVGIGKGAFYYSQLEGISLPSTIIRIEESAFQFCKGIASFVIPENVEYIGDCAFSDSDLAESHFIPNRCKYLGRSAFAYTNITELTIEPEFYTPSIKRVIKAGAFSYCKYLSYVNFNQLQDDFEGNPFYGCSKLNTIKGYGQYTDYPNYCSKGNLIIDGCLYKFDEYDNIRYLELICCPGGMNSYTCPNYFTGVENKKHVLTTLGTGAFGGCTKITFLDIPNTVKIIKENALFMPLGETIPDHDYIYRKVYIPESVEEMGEDVFGWWGKNWDIYLYSTHITNIYSSSAPGDGSKYGTIHIPYGTLSSFGTEWTRKAFNIIDDIGPDNFSLEDGTTFYNDTKREDVDVTYTRTFNNTNWQALYVPFSMSYDDWKDDFDVAEINNFHEYDDDEDGTVDRTTLEVVYKKSGNTLPNTPYVIRAKQTGTKTISLDNTTLYPAEENSIDCSSVKTKYTFTGTYSGVSGEAMYGNGYYALAGGTLSQASSSSVFLGSFRWYLKSESRTNSNVAPSRQISVKVIGEDVGETADIVDTNVNDSPVEYFNIRGNKIEKSEASGIYIVRYANGRMKKVIKK